MLHLQPRFQTEDPGTALQRIADALSILRENQLHHQHTLVGLKLAAENMQWRQFRAARCLFLSAPDGVDLVVHALTTFGSDSHICTTALDLLRYLSFIERMRLRFVQKTVALAIETAKRFYITQHTQNAAVAIGLCQFLAAMSTGPNDDCRKSLAKLPCRPVEYVMREVVPAFATNAPVLCAAGGFLRNVTIGSKLAKGTVERLGGHEMARQALVQFVREPGVCEQMICVINNLVANDLAKKLQHMDLLDPIVAAMRANPDAELLQFEGCWVLHTFWTAPTGTNDAVARELERLGARPIVIAARALNPTIERYPRL